MLVNMFKTSADSTLFPINLIQNTRSLNTALARNIGNHVGNHIHQHDIISITKDVTSYSLSSAHFCLLTFCHTLRLSELEV